MSRQDFVVLTTERETGTLHAYGPYTKKESEQAVVALRKRHPEYNKRMSRLQFKKVSRDLVTE